MSRVATVALALALGVAAFGGCGDTEDERLARPGTSVPASGAIELTIAYDDGAGTKTTGSLTCRGGEQRASGALAAPGRASAATLCARARAIDELLKTQPDKGRVCTQIYGGPETARVTGTIDGVKVDRRFARTNGCEIADFSRAAGLLQP
ncbi:MAG TPA: hypothetical protein VGR11_05600 [Solirubrobacteraceae bacterium]|nr:hypothetical protein [Solirubrobacteraceae bacterium]